MQVALPDESSLRKQHLNSNYNACLASIRENLTNAPLWLSIDETSDAMGHCVANVLLAKLDPTRYEAPYLVDVQFMDKAPSGSDIAKLVNDTLRTILPGFNSSNILLFVTDRAPYMLKAGRTLKELYPAMMHVSCLCHGLHNLAEEVGKLFPRVNEIISTTKKIFVKAPSRKAKFWEACPDIQLPPEPIVTH